MNKKPLLLMLLSCCLTSRAMDKKTWRKSLDEDTQVMRILLVSLQKQIDDLRKDVARLKRMCPEALLDAARDETDSTAADSSISEISTTVDFSGMGFSVDDETLTALALVRRGSDR